MFFPSITKVIAKILKPSNSRKSDLTETLKSSSSPGPVAQSVPASSRHRGVASSNPGPGHLPGLQANQAGFVEEAGQCFSLKSVNVASGEDFKKVKIN